MKISQRDLFKATMSHEKVEGQLFYADFIAEADEKVREHFGLKKDDYIREKLGMFAPVDIQPRLFKEVKHDFSKYYENYDIPENAWIDGGGVLTIPGSSFHFTRWVSPLRDKETLEDIMEFPAWPDVENIDTSHYKPMVEEAKANGKVTTTWCGRLYESAWPVRGYEEMLMDMSLNEDITNYIFNRYFEQNMKLAIAAAEAKFDMIMFGDDVGSQTALMFSCELWCKYLKPRWKELWGTIKDINPDATIWYHSDGNVTEIVPHLVEIGLDVLNPVQPECLDPYAVKERFGDKLVIDSGIGTQTVLPFGTADEVRAACRKAITVLGADQGYIFSPSHLVEPEVPMKNILAFLETAQEFNP